MCFWVNQVCMFLCQSNVFINLSRWIFISSPVENLLPGLTPKKFSKFDNFPGESSSPHRGTETGCIKKGLFFKQKKNVFSRFLGLNFLVSTFLKVRNCYMSSSKTWKFRISTFSALMRKFTFLVQDKNLTNTG